MKRTKILLIVFFVVIIVISVLLFSNNEINSAEKLDKDYLMDKVIFQSKLDIYSENTIELTEKEFNGLVTSRLKERLNSEDISSRLHFEKLYLNLNKDYIYMEGNLKSLPTVITMDINTLLEEDKINFDIDNFSIGKLPVPKQIIKPLRLSKLEEYLYIDTSYFDEIDITNIDLNDNSIKINYKTNNDKIIERYIDRDQEEFVRSIVTLLANTEESRSLANNIVKAVLLTSSEKELPEKLLSNLKNNFINLDNKTKTNLIFTVIKHNVGYMLNILRG